MDADCLARAKGLVGENPDYEWKASLVRVIGQILAEKDWMKGYEDRFHSYHAKGETEIVSRVAAYYETSKANRVPQELDSKLKGMSLDQFLYGDEP